MPGVTGAGATQKLPLRGGGWSSGITIEGVTQTEVTTTFVRLVTPGYLETHGGQAPGWTTVHGDGS